uniref:Uncharacterized protein n=2 Tax=unclassified Caudoviricetes TaxID=2788787 RepID=A0A8S5NMH3_9CAUD|nr:MAG TPA: hypothetical protein [Myoviridae sp. ctSGm32]DAD98998.1 MAG TPA: hypothetical protein [Myoviridae sp. ctjs85]
MINALLILYFVKLTVFHILLEITLFNGFFIIQFTFSNYVKVALFFYIKKLQFLHLFVISNLCNSYIP